MRKNLLLLFAVASLVFIGCAKEKSIDSTTNNNNNNDNDIIGTWKFVEFHAQTQSTMEYREAGIDMMTDTYSDYVSINNGGTVTITADKFNTTNMTYTVNDMAKGYIYEGGQLLDSIEFPLIVTVPPVNSSSSYKKIGTDSLYFAAGGFVNIGGSSSPSAPGGSKFKIEGDKLYLTTKYFSRETVTDQGLSVLKTDRATLTTTLQRQ